MVPPLRCVRPESATASIPARRMGEPAEMAALVAYLCSVRADRVTDQAVPVDGGSSRHL
ncbi:MAG TPA: SDR family oxidoreductase [Blastococcus sp.]|nr:SDR family oxidoreductase [Blastococcus sp.]